MVKQPIEQCGCNNGIAEDLACSAARLDDGTGIIVLRGSR